MAGVPIVTERLQLAVPKKPPSVAHNLVVSEIVRVQVSVVIETPLAKVTEVV